jgi:hypothetical protein
MVLKHLAQCGRDFAKLADAAQISSGRPGTYAYENKCEFPDGRYIAVVQDPRAETRVNTIAFGHGGHKPSAYAPCLGCWDPRDDELKSYARATTRWVRERLMNLHTESQG